VNPEGISNGEVLTLDKDDGTIKIGSTNVGREDYACKWCLNMTFERHFVDFVVQEREALGFVDTRPKCWYGKGCRTQHHRPAHAQRLQHLCDETRAESRDEQNRARAPQAVQTGSVRSAPVVNVPGSPASVVAGQSGAASVRAAVTGSVRGSGNSQDSQPANIASPVQNTPAAAPVEAPDNPH